MVARSPRFSARGVVSGDAPALVVDAVITKKNIAGSLVIPGSPTGKEPAKFLLRNQDGALSTKDDLSAARFHEWRGRV